MKTNQELFDEANKIDFHCRKDGTIEGRVHSKHERELFFIKKAIEVHGINKYNYGLVQYVDNNKKVAIVCPLHGEFQQLPRTHTSGHGCPKCSNVHQYDTNEWITLAKKVHGDRYDYSKAVYTNNITKVEILCPQHGPFLQTPISHTLGHGCARCLNIHQYNTNEWIILAKKVHGNRYDYSNSEYINSNTKLEIICPEHGSFWQRPRSHIHDFQGCPSCAGQNQDILYLFKCPETGWYKIGITTRDIKKRIGQISDNIEEVFHVVCSNPREHETYLHKLYDKDREYNLLVKSGNTEFFSLNEEQVAKIRQYMASIAIN